MNHAQVKAIQQLWRNNSNGMSYREFRRSVKRGFDCLMVEWCGMWIGIETDGYAHS